jgi:hypothetical protein
MRPKLGNDADIGRDDRRSVDRRDERNVDRRRGNGSGRSAATRAKARAGVLVMVRRSTVLVRDVPDMRRKLRRVGMPRMLGATIKGARIDQGGLEPYGPNGGEGAKPGRAEHDGN